MQYKINHRSYFPYLLVSIAFFLTMLSMFLPDPLRQMGICLFGGALVVALALMPVFLLCTTVVTVEDGTLSIRQPLRRQTIPLDSIRHLRFRHIEEKRQVVSGAYTFSSPVYRVELEIKAVTDGQPCTISLNDSGTRSQGAFGADMLVPDQEIPLYQLYTLLREETGAEGVES